MQTRARRKRVADLEGAVDSAPTPARPCRRRPHRNFAAECRGSPRRQPTGAPRSDDWCRESEHVAARCADPSGGSSGSQSPNVVLGGIGLVVHGRWTSRRPWAFVVGARTLPMPHPNEQWLLRCTSRTLLESRSVSRGRVRQCRLETSGSSVIRPGNMSGIGHAAQAAALGVLACIASATLRGAVGTPPVEVHASSLCPELHDSGRGFDIGYSVCYLESSCGDHTAGRGAADRPPDLVACRLSLGGPSRSAVLRRGPRSPHCSCCTYGSPTTPWSDLCSSGWWRSTYSSAAGLSLAWPPRSSGSSAGGGSDLPSRICCSSSSR